MLIPGRNIFPITELEMPNFEWHQDLLEKNHFAVQQDFARIKGSLTIKMFKIYVIIKKLWQYPPIL
jgi:hypothetical protein